MSKHRGRTYSERVAAWVHRARHAVTVGLDGNLFSRAATRMCYVLGVLESPSYTGYQTKRERADWWSWLR